MFICPNCSMALRKMDAAPGVYWQCPSCSGRSATISLLRRNIVPEAVNELWQTARATSYSGGKKCPACDGLMSEVRARTKSGTERLDVCTVCQFVWFDAAEFESLPSIPKPTSTERQLPQEAREKLALMELDGIRRAMHEDPFADSAPDSWWQWIPGLLGMPVEHNAEPVERLPLVTWGLALLATVVSLLAFLDLRAAVDTLGLVPANLTRYGGATFVTSFLLHGGALHLLGNMYFFLVFGDNVEDWLGKWRFFLLIVCSALAGDVAHILGDPHSSLPLVGASAGISGVMAFYALKFPHVKLGFLFRTFYLIRWVSAPAYMMFIFWLLLQMLGVYTQLAGFSNVSALGHLGGASIGFIFWYATRKE